MRLPTLALLLAALGLTGCGTPNVALISTEADPDFNFVEPASPSVVVRPLRGETFEIDFEPTLQEKVLVDQVSEGLRQAGFVVRGATQDADFTVLCRAETVYEEYDSYDRVPVTNTSIGYYSGGRRRGTRMSYGVHHSSVIVPMRRQYTIERLDLVALDHEEASVETAIGQNIELLAVWSALVSATGPRVINDHVWQTFQAASLWGRTADARIPYDVQARP